MRSFRTLYLIFFILFLKIDAFSQKSLKDSSINFSIVSVSYGYQVSGGDLQKRFGNSSSIGVEYMMKTQSNWLFGYRFNFIFGNNVKEDSLFKKIGTNEGFVISKNGRYSDVRLYERGYETGIKVGRLFPTGLPNKNSGIMATVGIGFLEHKIRIENIGNDAIQLGKEYRKGYDRLTNGLQLNQFLGYLFMDNRKFINLYAGVELSQAFTQNRRSFNFDTKTKDTTKRMDALTTFRIGFILPLYPRAPDQFYYR